MADTLKTMKANKINFRKYKMCKKENPLFLLEADRVYPGQYGETPSLLKIQNLAGHGGACL